MKILLLNPPDLNKVSEYALDEYSKEYIESDDFDILLRSTKCDVIY